MKIEVFAISYNEEVLMPYFMRNYAHFTDKITIFDNESTDRTRDIAREWGAEVITWSSNNEIRDDLYLKIKNNCWKHSIADWVIVCDIDEFVRPFNFDLFASPEITIIQPEWYEMVNNRVPLWSEEPNRLDRIISFGIKMGTPCSKAIMFRPQQLIEINYAPGCHFCNSIPQGIIVTHTSEMAILHYKNLSPEYVADRHEMFGKRLSEVNKQNKWGVQYEYSRQQSIDYWQELWNNKEKLF